MYNTWKITWREILFSTLIIAAFFGIGVWISNAILNSTMEESRKVISSVKVTDDDKFDYIKRTNVGFFLAEGELIANDTIRISDIPGAYSRIEKVKEEYRAHVETYTTTDGKGHTQVRTRVVHSWDVVGRQFFEAKTYTFLGHTFTGKEIGYRANPTRDTTIYNRKLWGNDVRYIYYTTPFTVNGVMSGTVDDKKFNDTEFRRYVSIEQIIEKAERRERNAPIIFWVLWWLVIGCVVFLFYICDNEWLEDKKSGK